jgi:hypothetical protein
MMLDSLSYDHENDDLNTISRRERIDLIRFDKLYSNKIQLRCPEYYSNHETKDHSWNQILRKYDD